MTFVNKEIEILIRLLKAERDALYRKNINSNSAIVAKQAKIELDEVNQLIMKLTIN